MLITFFCNEFVYVSDEARNSKGIELSADAAPFCDVLQEQTQLMSTRTAGGQTRS